MIESDKRKAVYLLHEEGMGIREICKSLHLSRKSVRRIIKDQGAMPKIVRADRSQVNPELLTKLYGDCQGFIQRVHEKLTEEEGVKIKYSTLTRLVRSMGLGINPKDNRRDFQVPDQPGKEMQQDTSPYLLTIAKRPMKVVGSSIYLRYSKRRYLKFYRSFNRFRMKCFFHEALTHFEYAGETCIIDNTNLAVLSGTGPDAVMVPEMIAFARDHGGFKWEAHRIMHSDRKGGVESGFWFVETNFFPGREFESLEDLNAQAMAWATERIPLRPHAKTKLIPAQLFEFEKPHLKKLPPFMPEPLLLHERETDQYGYAAFDGNYYWIPGTGRGRVQVIEYSSRIRIMRNREQLAEYPLPAYGVKNERFRPQGISVAPYSPRNCKRPTETEENRLKAIDPAVASFLEFLERQPGASGKRYRSIRRLFSLSLKLSPKLLADAVSRAHRYRITDMDTVERIASQLMRENSFQMDFFEPDPDLDQDMNSRDIYREGEMSDLPDLGKYDGLLEQADSAASDLDDDGNDGEGESDG